MMIMWFFIIIGNTGFPVMLRFVIWVLAQIVPKGTGLWEELRFLLDHPRRCFTLLFPSSANWWLFWILAALNAIDLLFFVVLDVCSSSAPLLYIMLTFASLTQAQSLNYLFILVLPMVYSKLPLQELQDSHVSASATFTLPSQYCT